MLQIRMLGESQASGPEIRSPKELERQFWSLVLFQNKEILLFHRAGKWKGSLVSNVLSAAPSVRDRDTRLSGSRGARYRDRPVHPCGKCTMPSDHASN